jgi:hypothetical protein
MFFSYFGNGFQLCSCLNSFTRMTLTFVMYCLRENLCGEIKVLRLNYRILNAISYLKVFLDLELLLCAINCITDQLLRLCEPAR